MIFLPDTNTLSLFLRAKDVRLRDHLIESLECCRLSSIALAELEYGAAKRPDIPIFRQRVETLRSMFPAVAIFDDHAAFHTGQIRAYLENLSPNAQPIGPYDNLLAGQALALGATIVTHNTREFRRVPGLAVEDWQSA